MELGSSKTVEAQLLRFALGAFPNAWRERRTGDGGRPPFAIGRAILHNPVKTLLAVLAVIFGPEMATGAWQRVELVFIRSQPFRDPARVMLVYPSNPFLEGPPGVLPIKYLAWREKCRSFEALAAFRFRETHVADLDGRPVKEEVLAASASLLPLLGARPALGRAFLESDEQPNAPPVVMLSDDLWRSRFRGDPNILGRAIDLGGNLHTIIGILPPKFWFLSARAGIWVPLAEDLDPAKGLPPLLNLGPPPRAAGRVIPAEFLNSNPVSVVVRVKAGANLDLARYELRTTARRTYPASARDWVRLAPVDEFLKRGLYSPVLVTGFAAALATLIACAGVARLLWRRRRNRPESADVGYWAFFAAKSDLGLLAIACVWIWSLDPSGNPPPIPAFGEFSGLVVTWLYALAACGYLHWSWRDQRLRCHVCLRRMRIPAYSGSWGSYLLNRPRTEYLCPAGHGTVSVAPSEPGSPDTSDWKNMDDSWRELFRGS